MERHVKQRLRTIIMRYKSEKESCFVCGKYKEIAELHHIVTVKELSELIVRYEAYDVELYMPHVWLCPNHHRIIHALLKSNYEAFNCLADGEVQRFDEIQKMVSLERLREMFRGRRCG